MPLHHTRLSFSWFLIFALTKQEMSQDTDELNWDFLRGYDKTKREWRRQTVFFQPSLYHTLKQAYI